MTSIGLSIFAAVAFSYTAVAATPSIGIASAPGSIRVDGLLVKGNATMFDGNLVETGTAWTALRLGGGVLVRLAAGSRGRVFGDRLMLEKGTSEFTGGYRVEAAALKITPSGPTSRGVVAVKDQNKIEVTALAGGVQVMTDRGVLLANVRPGLALAFDSQAAAGPAAPTTITGILSKVGDAYFVTVPTGIKYQVTGAGLNDSMIGKRVTVTGTPDTGRQPAGTAAAVIAVSSVSVAAAAGTAAAATATGMALGTKLIITGVVVAAATGVSAGVYQAQQDDEPASR